MEITFDAAVLLFFVALLAGIVDAIAGGGGLITIPALLAAGLPPGAAIATNKIGGIAGSAAATLHFLRMRQIDLKRSRWMMLTTFLGSLAGGFALTRIDSDVLRQVIPLPADRLRPVLPAVAARRRRGPRPAHRTPPVCRHPGAADRFLRRFLRPGHRHVPGDILRHAAGLQSDQGHGARQSC